MKNSRPFSHRRAFLLAIGAGAPLALGWPLLKGYAPSAGLRRFERSGAALGAQVSIIVLHADARAAELALTAAFAELELVEGLMSIYRPQSQLSRLNETGRLAAPHPYLLEVLAEAQATSEVSDGAFDTTVQPLWSLYADADRHGRVPSEAEISAARALVDYRRLELGADEVRLGQPGMAITLNGIAQGFAADCVARSLTSHGVQHALINTGELFGLSESGDAGQPTSAAGWKVGIEHPRQSNAFAGVAQLQGRALATSGDYRTTFGFGNEAHHIFDPATGRSPHEVASVSVVAKTAMTADALSTTAFVLGPRRTVELLKSIDDVDVLFVLKDGRTFSSAGFPFSA